MNRLSESQSFFRGMNPGDNPVQGGLRAFEAYYRFDGHTFGILVWEACWEDAAEYCINHGMSLHSYVGWPK